MPRRAPALHPEQRRAAIVDVAVPLLREHGAALTTRQVAEAAGIAEGTLFRAFGSKDELVQACCAAVLDPSEVVTRLRAIDPALPLDERLEVAVSVLRDHAAAVLALVVALRGTAHLPPRRPVATRRRREVDAALVAVVGADAAGLRRPVEEVVAALSDLTMASVHPMFSGCGRPAADVVSVVLDGTRRRG